MSGLSEDSVTFVDQTVGRSYYDIIIAGANFGCGSSREHAPIALGASGIQAIISDSFARIFFRNCISTGELLPIQSDQRFCNILNIGDIIEILPDTNQIILPNNSTPVNFKDLGSLVDIVNAGGLFKYARSLNKIAHN